MPSFKDKLVWNLKKLFHRPTVQIGKANILLYVSLLLIFIIALVFRLFPILKYTSELRALDPYVQFKAANYIVENGLAAYFSWHETMAWYPTGVNMGPYLYLGAPLSGVTLYYFFNFLGFNITLYDTCVVTPAILGALSCIAIYFLGKELAGNKKTGIIAAFFLAICVGFQARTIAGFYDNEAIGLFGMILFFFFFLKALKTGAISYSVLSGFSLALLCVSWGAYTYIWNLLSLSVLFLVLLKKYSSRLLLSYGVTFSISLLAIVLLPRTGWRKILGGEAIINFGIIGLLLLLEIYRRFKTTSAYEYILAHWRGILRVSLFGLLILLIVTSITGALQVFVTELISGDFISLTGGRYLTVIFPWVSNYVVQSVAEHTPSSWALFYYNYEFLLFLFPLGLYFLFRRLYEEDVIIITFGLTTVYFAGSMSRLQMVFAPACCLIAAFGIASLIKPFSLVMRKKFVTVRRRKRMTSIVTREISVAIFSLLFFFLIFTSIHGTYNAAYQISPGMAQDFRETFAWMRANLDSTAVVVSWWDYGYQTTTVGEVTSVVDNGTWNNTAMGMVGRQFMAIDELESIEILKSQWNAEYVLVSWSYFFPNGGGDEGKWQWMIRIASETIQHTKYAIEIEERWNETSYKPTCEFLQTTLWKMLTYGEPFIDYDQKPGLIEELLRRNYPLGYFQARLNWADPWIPGSRGETGQWKDDSGHLWKYHNPPLGDGMIDDGVVDYTGDGLDDTVGQFANLKYFSPVFISAGHLVKVFKIEYERAELRAEITDTSQLFNNSIATITVHNNGYRDFEISSVNIAGQAVNFIPISGTTSTVKPGEQVHLKAYGPNVPLGGITNGTSYTVGATVSDKAIYGLQYTATKQLTAQVAPLTNMSIDAAQIRALSNDTILVPITNTGENLLQVASIKVNNETVSNFGTYYTSVGTNQVDLFCNYTNGGFSHTNITATRGDQVNFHVTNLKPASTIKFGIAEFNQEITVNYGQTQTLLIGADRNGTFPFYCYEILWPPGEYNVGNLTINYAAIQEKWDYKFVPVDQTTTFYIYPSTDIRPDDLINLTISTNDYENVTRRFSNLRVVSPYSCITVSDAKAYANETLIISIKNTGSYDEKIDHFWLNNEIFDMFSSPNPHGLSIAKNQTRKFTLTFPSTILNLNITSPYDPLPLYINITLQQDRQMGPESQHSYSLPVINDYIQYNITISDDIYSNETLIINVTNVGKKNVTVSDVWVNNVSTTLFQVAGPPIVAPTETKTFNITSNLDLNYLDIAQIMVRTFEGPYSVITRTVAASGNINITWSEAYQDNRIILLNVSNLDSSIVTVKEITINSIPAFDFGPIDDSFNPLPPSFNSIPAYGSQLFNVTISATQFSTLDLTLPLLVNVTTYEGAFTDHNVTWAWALKADKLFAFTNDTVIVHLQNVGRYPITIQQINLNSTATDFTIISGSSTPSAGTSVIFKLTSTAPLNFGNVLKVEVIANYTAALDNLTFLYTIPFVLYDGPNITIIPNWPHTVAYDNNSISNNDTVYLTLMNTGNETLTIANFFLNNGTHFVPHQFITVQNTSVFLLEPYQVIQYVNYSLLFDISAEMGGFLDINVTTDKRLSATNNLSVFTSLRVLHSQPNITIMENNATIALHYTTIGNPTTILINLTNYGDTILTINLNQYPTVNGTAYFSGTIILNPGESVELDYIITPNGPVDGTLLNIFVRAEYDSNYVTDQLTITVYEG
ncbi:MAG: hypothetical protein EU536_01860 [Promethearchaeota archaeon]|nr:MAG: hypothetical protein EU536_01860 [Candidatus Lokiarchaeota archaeon]